MYRTGIRAPVSGVEVDIPIVALSAGQYLYFNGSQLVSQAVSAGGISGPGTTTSGNIVTWNSTTGAAVADGGTTIAALQAATAARGDFFGPAGSVSGNVVSFANTTGKLGADSGKLASDLVTGPASATSASIPTFNGTTGKVLQDGGVLLADVVRSFAGPQTANRLAVFVGTAPASVASSSVAITQVMQNTTGTPPVSVAGNIPTFTGTNGVSCQDSGVAIANLPAFQKACRATSATTTAAATMTDIAGLAFFLPAAGTYAFEFIPIFSSSSATGTIGIAATCATATAFIMGGLCPTSATAVSHLVCTAINTASVNSGARGVGAGVNTMATFSGTIAVSGAGTLQFQMIANTSGTLTSAIGSGGFCTRVT